MVEKEKDLERKLTKLVKLNGGWALKFLPTLVSGLPDRIVLLPEGKLFFAEIKETGKKPSRIQDVVIGKIRELGFRVEVVDSSEQIHQILQDYGFHRRY